MKTTHKLALLASIFCSTALPTELTLTPENTVIVTDLDDVLIEKTFILSLVALLKPLERLIKPATKNELLKPDLNSNVPTDKKLYGYTLPFLRYGMKHPWLAPYIPWIVERLAKSRHIIDGTHKIYAYLKQKGYTIVIATNKDRVAYDLTVKALNNTFTDVITHTFVANPTDNAEIIAQLKAFANKPNISTNYKQLLNDALSKQSTTDITLIPSRKPDYDYFTYMNEKLDKKKNIIFIDDKVENIKSFNKLQNATIALRHGIIFKNPTQLAEELINIGILSELNDKQLLDEIRYPGIMRIYKYIEKATHAYIFKKRFLTDRIAHNSIVFSGHANRTSQYNIFFPIPARMPNL